MRRNTMIQLIALALGLIALAGSGVFATQLAASAGRHKLVYTDRAVEGDPPQVGVGIAMGAFRGLFVNMLWMRANDAKEKGRYHEAMDLARAITALQPRFEDVWVFHAWNMAYNISVTSQSPEERWRWVDKGIRLLRDEGLVYNPNSLLIHKELAWIFMHKIGGYTDDSNRYYKRELAAEWTEVLGPPPPPAPLERSRQGAIDAYVAWLSPIADAPRTLAGVYDAQPSARDLVEQIRSRITTNLDARFLERYTTARALADSVYKDLDIPMGPKSAAMYEMVRDPQRAEAWAALLPYVRRSVLVDEYHMDPQRMVRYTKKYGPIDWRHPAAHALYWSTKGVEAAMRRIDDRTKKDFDIINSDRVVIQSIQELYRSGEVYFSYLNWKIPELRPGGTVGEGAGYVFYQGVPNAHFVDTYSQVVREIAERAKQAGKSWAESEQRIFSLYSAGYENFLQDAVRFFYRRGQIDKANEYHYKLLTYERINLNDSARADELGQDLETFIAEQFEDDRYASPYVANSEVEAALQSAWINGLLAGDNEMFRKNLGYAQRFHRAFMDKQVKAVAAGQVYQRQAIMEPDFRMLAGMSFGRTIASLDLQDAETVYDHAPEDLKQFGFWVLQDLYARAQGPQAVLGGRTFDQVFPEPQGWDAFTVWLNQRIQERSRALQQGEQG